jgi:hypothetical protein
VSRPRCVQLWGFRMPDRSYDRLDNYMDAYNLTEAARRFIRKRVIQAGLSADDPVAILVALTAIEELRTIPVLTALKGFPDQVKHSTSTLAAQISKAASKDIDRRNSAFLNGLRVQVGADVDLAIRQSVAQADIRYFQRAALGLTLICLLSALIFGTLGFAFGRQEVQSIERDYAHVIARPDARTWIRLIENNTDIDVVIAKQCLNGGPQSIPQANGREACAMPLWIDDGGATSPAVIAPYFSAIFKWVPSQITAWVLILCSLSLGGFLGVTAKWLHHKLWPDGVD